MTRSYSISELNQLIKSTLDMGLDPTYWVVGEMTDFRVAAQGHAYFELVEKSGNQVQAKIRANLWAFTYREVAYRFESVTGTQLKSGMKVLAQVSVAFHPLYGLSANVKDIDPSFSLGERARIRQETIAKLTEEGLLRLNASAPLPPVLQKIGIISSPTAAGYGDFVQQLDQNFSGFKIYHKLFPAAMQGNEAAQSIISALRRAMNEAKKLQLDAIVIIRGGGAQLDLDCFDEYMLAKEIALTRLPILTGIGHERDETIADLVANTRLKTPTAVAEFILSSFRAYVEQLRVAMTQVERITRSQLQLENSRIDQIHSAIKSRVLNSLFMASEKVKNIKAGVKSSAKNSLQLEKVRLDTLQRDLKKASVRSHALASKHLEQLEKNISQLDPNAILKRGYTRTEFNGTPIDAIPLKEGDEILTISSRQRIKSTIKKINRND
ncbi:exodeoxyribonuclease VII large subunit [Algoriphagus namhaensis]